jgi:hypothetical protein
MSLYNECDPGMTNAPIALEAVATSPRERTRMAATLSGVHRLCGRAAVSAKMGMLKDLAQRTGQAAEMHWLDYHLNTPTALKKIPALVLVGLDGGVDTAEAGADDLIGAVLLYEYGIAGRGSGVFATDDTNGEHTVIAPRHIRVQVAEAACQALVQMGALTVMVTVEGRDEERTAPWVHNALTAGCEMARRSRLVPRHLPLGETHEATLASLGRHTRRNLRYYRRRLESELGAVFVPEVAMERAEFLAINRASMNPAPESLAAWRYDSTQRWPGAMFAGVKARDGRWLSLIGGRRHMDKTEIDWQMNLAGLARYSLSTAMRSYVLQHEVERGTTRLEFMGGTPHSIRHSFACLDAVDVIAVSRSPASWMLRRLARWIFPENNFLGHVLRDPDLHWSP